MTRRTDIDAIIAVTYAYAAGIDRRDWEMYRNVFTDPCEFDFSSFNNAPKVTLTPDQWTVGVRSVNGNFDATQHQITNHVVQFDGESTATCVAELRAQHWFSPATMSEFGLSPDVVNWCEIGGHYTNSMQRVDGIWKISRCHLTVRWQLGNDDVFERARRRHR
jgi:3-phenylpropionate/cinnamic acid dioxygenase small subunit